MRKVAVWVVLAFIITAVFSPIHDAAAAQYYRRWLPNKTLSCAALGGGLVTLTTNNQDVAHSNPTNNATTRYVIIVNGVTVFTSPTAPMENGVGTATYPGLSQTGPLTFPLTVAVRNETILAGITVYTSTVQGTCTGPSVDNPTRVTNAVSGESTFRRWLENKTANCALDGDQAAVIVSNQDVEYNNLSGTDLYTVMTTSNGAQISLTGALPTEPNTGTPGGGAASYPPLVLNSGAGFPLDMTVNIDSYTPQGAWRFRSTMFISCAAAGPATLTYFELVASGQNNQVLGTLDLQGRPTGPSAARSGPVTVQVYGSGSGGLVFSRTLTSNSSGIFVFEGLAPATYRFFVKTPTTLRVLDDVAVLVGSTPQTFGPMREGDADNDNAVSIADFSLLAAAFGTSVGQLGFNSSTDFDKNGSVNVADFSLLAASFGQAGVTP